MIFVGVSVNLKQLAFLHLLRFCQDTAEESRGTLYLAGEMFCHEPE